MNDYEKKIAAAEKRVFDKWYATASIGAKLKYWMGVANGSCGTKTD